MNICPQYNKRKHTKPRQRSKGRSDNVRRVLAELETRDMLRDEIGALLNFSPSGTRKYVKDLLESRVIELAGYADPTPTYIGHPVYRLTFDAELLRHYMTDLDANVYRSAISSPAPLASPRHIYTSRDDIAHPVKLSDLTIPADPWMLPREFFQGVTA